MLYINPPNPKSICDPAIEKTQDISAAKIIDFFEAREKLINEAQQYDRQFELDQDVQANSQKEKRFVILRDPMEDAVLIFLAAAFVVALILMAFANSS
jgi:L-2-hydroxyglutarate oxidase LhgO